MAIPYGVTFCTKSTAIGMQRDFRNDESFNSIPKIIPVVRRALEASWKLRLALCILERDVYRLCQTCLCPSG